jgi:hypothetical protein
LCIIVIVVGKSFQPVVLHESRLMALLFIKAGCKDKRLIVLFLKSTEETVLKLTWPLIMLVPT